MVKGDSHPDRLLTPQEIEDLIDRKEQELELYFRR